MNNPLNFAIKAVLCLALWPSTQALADDGRHGHRRDHHYEHGHKNKQIKHNKDDHRHYKGTYYKQAPIAVVRQPAPRVIYQPVYETVYEQVYVPAPPPRVVHNQPQVSVRINLPSLFFSSR